MKLHLLIIAFLTTLLLPTFASLAVGPSVPCALKCPHLCM
jgi:hypothetical protein